MGVWNATCAVSHLPILEGEPCAGILLTYGIKQGNTCYPEDRFHVLSPPISGTYDGYGALQDILPSDMLLQTLTQKNIIERFDLYPDLEHFLYNVVTGEAKLAPRWCNPAAHDNTVFLALVKTKFLNFAQISYSERVQETKRLQDVYHRHKHNDNFLGMPLVIENWAYLLTPTGRTHSVATALMRAGHDFSDIAALNKLMLRTRQEWLPPTACGSQAELEYHDQLSFYHLVASTADEMAANNTI